MTAVSGDQAQQISRLVASPKAVGLMIDCGLTRVYELIKSGEILSYRDGKSRKIVISSVKDYIERRLGEESGKKPPGWTDRATQARIDKRKSVARPAQRLPEPSVLSAALPNSARKGTSAASVRCRADAPRSSSQSKNNANR